jgi:hypothetical protein
MAIKETVEVEVESNATEQAKEFTDAVEDQSKAVEDFGKNSKKGFQAAEKGTKNLGTSFKTLLKASVVFTLIEKAVGLLADAFKQNQKVVSAFNVGFEFVSLIVGQVVEVISNVVEQVGKSTENFDALKKVGEGLLTVALTPLKLTFQAIRFGVLKLSLAYEKSFLGKGRPERIEELTAGLNEVKESMVEIGSEGLEAAKSVVNNIGEAVQEAGDITKKVVDGVKDINVKATAEQAKATVALKNEAELAEARLQGLIEKFDLQAEKQRQIRDDERLSIDERIAANERLGEILQEQQEAQLEQAQKILDSANANLLKDKENVEFKKAQIQAENELAATKAQVAGFEAEQLTNLVSLERERLELQLAQKQNDLDVLRIGKEVAIQNANTTREAFELEKQLSQEQFEGQQRALIERLQSFEKTSADYKATQQELALLDAERLKTLNDERIKDIKLEQEAQDAKFAIASSATTALNGLVQSLAGENEKAQKKAFLFNKAAGIANAIINTAQAITKIFAETTDPTPTQSFRFGNAAIALATGLAQVATISRTQFGGSSTPTLGGAGGGAPQFNVVGDTGTNAIVESLQRNNQPVRAFVVGSDVTTQQSLDRNRVDNATFG